jgi:hypothetical protein
VTKQETGPAPEYGSGLGYLADNPLTRGLAQAGSATLSAADYASNRFLGTPLKNPLTGERFTNEESQLEAPKDASGISKFVQGAANVAGSVAQAGAVGGGIGGAALLRGGAAIGVPQALNIAQQHEQETGKQEGLGKLTAEAVAGTVAGMIPFGKAGAGIIRNALTGSTAGIAGDLMVRAIAGDQATPEEIAKSGLTSGILSAIMHLPASGKKALNDALGTPLNEDDLAKAAVGHKGDIDFSKDVPFKEDAVKAVQPHVDTAEESMAGDPTNAQAIHDEIAAKLPPEQQGAFTGELNKHLKTAYDNAPEVKPLQKSAAAEPAAAPENQAAPDKTNAAAPAVEAKPD